MRTCTKCSAEIRKGDPYRTTKRGDHHQNCVVSARRRCGKRVTFPKGFAFKLRCKENGNHVRFESEVNTFNPAYEPMDGEFHVADELGKSWVVIGLNDILDALRLAGFGAKRLA